MAGTCIDSADRDAYPPDEYADYLASAMWRRIKKRVLVRDDRICYFCGGRAVVVHHRSYAVDVLEGRADHLLVSLCNYCHTYIHFDDAGARLSPEKTDLVLLTRAAPKNFPEPEFRVGQRLVSHIPIEWARMNAAQRAGWLARFVEVRAKVLGAVVAKKRIKAERKATRPPAEPGWMRLEEAVLQHKREMVNSYAWYRKDAMRRGSVSIGTRRVQAEKRNRVWCVRVVELTAAIEAYRRNPPRAVVMGMDIGDR